MAKVVNSKNSYAPKATKVSRPGVIAKTKLADQSLVRIIKRPTVAKVVRYQVLS